MLVLLPPSETKTAVRRGKAFDPAGLSFPPLAPTRAAVLGGADGGQRPARRHDASRGAAPAWTDVVRRNVTLRDAPTAAAEAVYSGVLYDALGAGRPRRRVPAPCPGVDRGDLGTVGRGAPGRPHPAVPAEHVRPPARASATSPTCGADRSPTCCPPPPAAVSWSTAARPSTPPCGDRRARSPSGPSLVKVVRDRDGKRGAVSHNAKYTRGLVARRIVTDAHRPARGPRGWPRRCRPTSRWTCGRADRSGRPWELHVVEPVA